MLGHCVLQLHQQYLILIFADCQGHLLFLRNLDLMVRNHDLEVHVLIQRNRVFFIIFPLAEIDIEADEQHTARPALSHHLLMVNSDEGARLETRMHLLFLVNHLREGPLGWVELLRVVLPKTVGDPQVLKH